MCAHILSGTRTATKEQQPPENCQHDGITATTKLLARTVLPPPRNCHHGISIIVELPPPPGSMGKVNFFRTNRRPNRGSPIGEPSRQMEAE
jgi:hypothetical protein